uniref:Uncharacterized protein n=1 Tax=Lotus japonicus TaxID=34305 RepID=I3SJM6_LOTJA|nr:unknown [Lotus japonicus]
MAMVKERSPVWTGNRSLWGSWIRLVTERPRKGRRNRGRSCLKRLKKWIGV